MNWLARGACRAARYHTLAAGGGAGLAALSPRPELAPLPHNPATRQNTKVAAFWQSDPARRAALRRADPRRESGGEGVPAPPALRACRDMGALDASALLTRGGRIDVIV